MSHPDKFKDNNIHHNLSSEIGLRLLKAPPAHHYLVLYPNIETLRNVYANYIELQLEEQDSVILFLPYYDTTDKVREVLITKGVDVSRHERNGSLVLLDFDKIIDNPYLGVPAAFGLKEFVNKVQSRITDKTLVVIADMSIYNHLDKVEDLLDCEKLPHTNYQIQKWKELCLYHKVDFDSMFTIVQKHKIVEYHNDKTFLID